MDKNYIELKNWLMGTRDEPLETMGGFFDRRVQEYEDHMAHWQNHYKWMAETLPDGTATLLDIGCGTGLELDWIFRRFPDISVTGVDLSGEMLSKLSEKHMDKALTLICGDYFLWDMGVERYDAVISFETLHHFTPEKKAGLFRKIYKSLKPGGVYIECDYIASCPQIEELTFAECARRRRRDGIGESVFVHFDTPLTLEHELQAIGEGGFSRVELLGFLPEDDHTPMIRAVK